MDAFDWKMISADGKCFEVSGVDFFAQIVLGDLFGKVANSQNAGKRIWFKRKRIFFPIVASIECEGQLVGRITSWIFWHKIKCSNGDRFFVSSHIFNSSIAIKDSNGELILRKTMPKPFDRGIGKILVYQPGCSKDFDKLVPSLFYAPALSHATAFLFLGLASLVQLAGFLFRFFVAD